MIIEGINFDADKVKAYEDHIYKRLLMLDERDIQVKEDERTQLHENCLDSAQPNDRLKAKEALEKYIGQKFAGLNGLSL